MFVCCVLYCVLSGRGLCDELITRPDESYRLWRFVVCDQETSWATEGHSLRWAAQPEKMNVHIWTVFVPLKIATSLVPILVIFFVTLLWPIIYVVIYCFLTLTFSNYMTTYFFICFVVCATGASPVGISQNIYSVYLYINIFNVYWFAHLSFLSLCKMYPETEEWLRLLTYRLFL
jgi:hypothetical protein